MKTINKKRLIFSNFFIDKLDGDRLIFVDAGARGEMDEPWKSVDNNIINVFGFEPDNKECERLNKNSYNRKYFPYALWSEKKEISIYSTKIPLCSSAYNPNIDLIKSYENKHWEPRKVMSIHKYRTSTIDSELFNKNIKADFLKVDTQGAEYEILKGSENTLKKHLIGFLVETWTTEVYKDQPLTDSIIKIARENGFDLFDIKIAAAWKRKTANLVVNGKRQIIGLDLLFFKKIDLLLGNFQKIMKAVALAEIYGFPDYALEIINTYKKEFPERTDDLEEMKRIIIKNSNVKSGFFKKIITKIKSLFGYEYSEYPSLHY